MVLSMNVPMSRMMMIYVLKYLWCLMYNLFCILLGLVLLSVFLTHKNKILAHDKKLFQDFFIMVFKRENQHKINWESSKELLCATGDRIYGAWEEIKPFSVSSLLTDPGSWILAVRFFLLSLWGQKLDLSTESVSQVRCFLFLYSSKVNFDLGII